MGNTASKIHDQLIDEQVADNETWLNNLAEEIKQTSAFGSEIIDRKWLERNREKILRNKKLIELIG